MLETRAIVVRLDGANAFVEAAKGNSCGQCKGTGCGASKLSRLFCSEPRQFQASNIIDAAVGDEVVVSLADGMLLRGISLVYLLPLTMLVAGAAVANFVAVQDGQRDGYAAAGGVLGLIVGFMLSRWLDVRKPSQLPRIVRQAHKD